ncbi:MAG: alpha/beta hydrolase family protein [Trebonia sp.]
MKVYFAEDDLDGQFQRTLTHAYERGADLGEAFATAARITPGDDESWYREWSATAATARAAAEASRDAGRVQSATDAFLRASEYHRQAMFYLRGDPEDPRLKSAYAAMRTCFRQAIPGLPFGIEPVQIPYEGTTLNGYLMTPGGPAAARPTVLFPAGYDSVAEEGHLYGAAAIRRGYAVLAFEGPGQGGVLYEHGLYLRPDFEAVLTPVVDFALTRAGVDGDRLALVGRSFAGYLAPRGATAEHRIAALVCDPGQVNLGARVTERVPAPTLELIRANDPKVDHLIAPMLATPEARRTWRPRMAAHGTPALRQYLRTLLEFTLEDRAAGITCPTLVTEGEGDFAGGQSQRLYELLTCPKTYRAFTAAEGTSGHMEGLGQQVWDGYVYDWLDAALAV